MGGVDHHDQLLYSYLDERKTVKTWKKCAFNIISRMLLNSYIIYKQNTSDRKKLKHIEFNLSVIASLSEEYLNNRSQQSRRSGSHPVEQVTDKSPVVRKLPQGKETVLSVVCLGCGTGLVQFVLCATVVCTLHVQLSTNTKYKRHM